MWFGFCSQAWRTEKLRRFYEISNILNNAVNFLAAVEPEVGSSSRGPAVSQSLRVFGTADEGGAS